MAAHILFAPQSGLRHYWKEMQSTDQTFKGLYHWNFFDAAVLLPYFAVMIVLALYGVHRYTMCYLYFRYRKNYNPDPPRHFEELPLVQAAIGFSWLRDGAVERRNRDGVKLILARLAEVLRAGVVSGELSTTLDVDLIAEMLWDSYVANYRRAIFDGWDMDALRARIATQIEVLLDGYQIAA